jgi:hypothetical protein
LAVAARARPPRSAWGQVLSLLLSLLALLVQKTKTDEVWGARHTPNAAPLRPTWLAPSSIRCAGLKPVCKQ